MKITIWDRMRGFVVWPQNRDPRIKSPQPRIISIAAADALLSASSEIAQEVVKEDNARGT